jgi:septum formation inhibitor MinC
MSDQQFSGVGVGQSDALRVITSRGTEDGLTIRIDGRAEWSEILRELEIFLGERKRFLAGCEVSIEWLDRLPTKDQSQQLEVLLREDYGVTIITRKKQKVTDVSLAAGVGAAGVRPEKSEKRDARGVTIPLFELSDVIDSSDDGRHGLNAGMTPSGVSPAGKGAAPSSAGGTSVVGAGFEAEAGFGISATIPTTGARRFGNRMPNALGEELFYDEDANAKVVFGTLRSGQRIETPFSLIVVGDVNPGADLIAGGDILVIGSLRGTAHASAYDDDCAERVIIALHMQPMQLRIGSVISRGSDEVVVGTEIARIEDRRIMVERYNPRFFDLKRRRELL